MEEVSYALGMTMANNFKGTGIQNLDVEAFAEAMKAVYEGKQPRYAMEEAREIIDAYFNKLQAEADEINIKAGAEYLAKNKEREGVIVTASGLQYEIIKAGTGAKPKETDTVRCHYEGRLLNGKVFDSSYARKEPADFPVNRVIPGWVEALQLMPVGSKWRLHIPSDLAYGQHGAGADIQPNSTLIFDVELLEIL
ncbi:MAG: FKBP-type peptidyl-prolyl cis-trans isomerase [Paludibacteraceae bacterium]|nr:FKBP-type peptidyl-prolyl cis-trans isomerase [Candidatus Physcocola equi]MCQ2234528.1 FKBP-type peptidyl-prolyl cis-trans isomerase [Paludibacteraceae bacterium]